MLSRILNLDITIVTNYLFEKNQTNISEKYEYNFHFFQTTMTNVSFLRGWCSGACGDGSGVNRGNDASDTHSDDDDKVSGGPSHGKKKLI